MHKQQHSINTTSIVHYLSGNFGDMDEFEEITQNWGLGFKQMECGKLNANLKVVRSLPTSIMQFGFNRRFYQQGQTPRGFQTFGIPGRETHDLKMYNRDIAPDMLLGFHPSGEFEGVSLAGFSGYTVSIAMNQLTHLAQILGIEITGNLLNDREHVLRGKNSLGYIRARISQLIQSITDKPSLSESAWVQQELEFGIPTQILLAYEHPLEAIKKSAVRKRDNAFKKAVEFIEENAPNAPTIADVCVAAQVSWRTLDYSFRERLGVTPKRYLMAVRLAGVYRGLRQASPDTRIRDIAISWGFWHMSQFARDYKSSTGEKPSDTLTKRRPCFPALSLRPPAENRK